MGRSVQQLVRWSAVMAMGVGLSGAFAVPASAAPDAERFEATCSEELGAVELTMGKAQGIWTPAFVVGSNQRLIPYEFEIVVNGIPRQPTKKPPKHGRLAVCEFENGFAGATGTVWVSYTPR